MVYSLVSDSVGTTAGTVFIVSDQAVNVQPDSLEGLYALDTRFLSRFQLTVNGEVPLPLRSGALAEGASTFYPTSGASGRDSPDLPALRARYGRTGIGMALSNPLGGKRVPGHVGTPLPGVEVRQVDEAGQVQDSPRGPGELEVRGPGVFLEYWRRPDETAAAFNEGWFRTGDMAVVHEGQFRLLGRTSIDILKSGGYKVSALEIEELFLEHPQVCDCAVVAIDDPEWGDLVCAAVVLEPGSSLDPFELRRWSKDLLAPYKVPRRMMVLDELPRNAMGKVTKPALSDLFRTAESGETQDAESPSEPDTTSNSP